MKQYVVDAFTDKVFSGNPAAVCIMDEWLPVSYTHLDVYKRQLMGRAPIMRGYQLYFII